MKSELDWDSHNIFSQILFSSNIEFQGPMGPQFFVFNPISEWVYKIIWMKKELQAGTPLVFV